MADKRCENGHFIDEAWDLCPYCPQEPEEPEIAIVRPRAVEAAPPVSLIAPAARPPRAATQPSISIVAQPPNGERTVAAPLLDSGAQKRYVVAWLVGLTGTARGEAFPVRMGRNVVGRDRRSDIVVDDEQASSHHADLVFRCEEKRFILMDHNSTNGTYVNDAEIEPRRDLMPRDVVRIGLQKFMFIPLCDDSFQWDSAGQQT